jgi:hypothetical protein
VVKLGLMNAIDGIDVEPLRQALGWPHRPPVTFAWVAATMAP